MRDKKLKLNVNWALLTSLSLKSFNPNYQ